MLAYALLLLCAFSNADNKLYDAAFKCCTSSPVIWFLRIILPRDLSIFPFIALWANISAFLTLLRSLLQHWPSSINSSLPARYVFQPGLSRFCTNCYLVSLRPVLNTSAANEAKVCVKRRCLQERIWSQGHDCMCVRVCVRARVVSCVWVWQHECVSACVCVCNNAFTMKLYRWWTHLLRLCMHVMIYANDSSIQILANHMGRLCA